MGLTSSDSLDQFQTIQHALSSLADYDFLVLKDRSWDGIEIYDPSRPFILNTKHDVKLLKQTQEQIYDILLTYIENEESKKI
jgi:hypothetical protein